MRKLILPVIVILVLAFYVAWPGWSAYQIHTAIKAKDADALARKIDLPAVRASLRTAAAQKIAELYVSPATAPTSPVLVERIKQDAVSRILEASLEALVTPDTLISVISEGGQLKDSVERALRDQISRGGGAITGRTGTGTVGAGKRGPVVRTVSTVDEAPAASYGLRNVKRFGIAGPLSFTIGVAKDAAASEPDATAELSFTGTDWKVTAIRPRL